MSVLTRVGIHISERTVVWTCCSWTNIQAKTRTSNFKDLLFSPIIHLSFLLPTSTIGHYNHSPMPSSSLPPMMMPSKIWLLPLCLQEGQASIDKLCFTLCLCNLPMWSLWCCKMQQCLQWFCEVSKAITMILWSAKVCVMANSWMELRSFPKLLLHLQWCHNIQMQLGWFCKLWQCWQSFLETANVIMMISASHKSACNDF